MLKRGSRAELLLTLGLLLLSCGAVEATEPNPKMWYIDPQLGDMSVSLCEKKMKEAMKIADQYMPRDYQGATGNTLEYCDSVCQAERALAQAKKEKQDLLKWAKVIMECVK